MTAPTSTVSPSAASSSARVPATGDGTSVSTLSVEISSKISSLSTLSPGFFNHRRILPSWIDSPILGITTSVIDPEATGAGAAAGAGTGAATGAGAGAATGAGAGAATGAETAACASEFNSAIMAPTSTVSFSWAKIAVRIPAEGDGTSVSTLSVEISKRISSRSTLSPGFFSQRKILPS